MLKDFSNNLRTLRESKGFSKKDMADKLGITPPSYGKFEHGQGFPSFETLTKIINVLGIAHNVNVLFENDSARKHQEADTYFVQNVVEAKVIHDAYRKMLLNGVKKKNGYFRDIFDNLKDSLDKLFDDPTNDPYMQYEIVAGLNDLVRDMTIEKEIATYGYDTKEPHIKMKNTELKSEFTEIVQSVINGLEARTIYRNSTKMIPPKSE